MSGLPEQVGKNKVFDCVRMKHDAQRRIYEETKGMTAQERVEYFRRGSEEFRRSLSLSPAPRDLKSILVSLTPPAAERRTSL